MEIEGNDHSIKDILVPFWMPSLGDKGVMPSQSKQANHFCMKWLISNRKMTRSICLLITYVSGSGVFRVESESGLAGIVKLHDGSQILQRHPRSPSIQQ